ncbi:hypothetical protein CEXT_289671 [Caerostris extrusa]|uniref:Uncharacterized protein n=1 Tax=Caerostris extrusa TaxID=172846 RepID=A0AAV4VPE1_CAEEX|nr:hypothetical protein CEXT_289671 [Caerostris extrusa]
MDKLTETYEEQFQEFYDNYNDQRAATMKLQDAYNDFLQCLSELNRSRKVVLESIANSLEPQWRDFPEFQAESGKSVSNVENFCNKLLTHLGNNAEKAVSFCERKLQLAALQNNVFKKTSELKNKLADIHIR